MTNLSDLRRAVRTEPDAEARLEAALAYVREMERDNGFVCGMPFSDAITRFIRLSKSVAGRTITPAEKAEWKTLKSELAQLAKSLIGHPVRIQGVIGKVVGVTETVEDKARVPAVIVEVNQAKMTALITKIDSASLKKDHAVVSPEEADKFSRLLRRDILEPLQETPQALGEIADQINSASMRRAAQLMAEALTLVKTEINLLEAV